MVVGAGRRNLPVPKVSCYFDRKPMLLIGKANRRREAFGALGIFIPVACTECPSALSATSDSQDAATATVADRYLTIGRHGAPFVRVRLRT